jgi:hypothetical protein
VVGGIACGLGDGGQLLLEGHCPRMLTELEWMVSLKYLPQWQRNGETMIRVLASYDLVTPPGLHTEFRKELELRSWSFVAPAKPVTGWKVIKPSSNLPNTTCWIDYKTDDARSSWQPTPPRAPS